MANRIDTVEEKAPSWEEVSREVKADEDPYGGVVQLRRDGKEGSTPNDTVTKPAFRPGYSPIPGPTSRTRFDRNMYDGANKVPDIGKTKVTAPSDKKPPTGPLVKDVAKGALAKMDIKKLAIYGGIAYLIYRFVLK